MQKLFTFDIGNDFLSILLFANLDIKPWFSSPVEEKITIGCYFICKLTYRHKKRASALSHLFKWCEAHYLPRPLAHVSHPSNSYLSTNLFYLFFVYLNLIFFTLRSFTGGLMD